MSAAVFSGLLLIVSGGVLNGSFALPMRFMPKWPWEATWLVFSICGLLIVPTVIALITLPNLAEIYDATSTRALVLASLFGFGWGIGVVLFGIGLNRLGMSLGFSIILGLGAALGSLIPMLVLSPQDIATPRGAALLAGVGVVVIGIYLCGRAAAIKDTAPSGVPAAARAISGSGLAICVLAGILIAMLNLSFAFGAEIAQRAVEHGATSTNAANAIWSIALASGAIANIVYCVFLLVRNRSGSAFVAPGTASHWLMGALTGTLWMSGVAVYGIGAASLGRLGAILGWPILQATIILTGNLLGSLTGEWREAPRGARRTRLAGLGVLTIAIFIIGLSSAL